MIQPAISARAPPPTLLDPIRRGQGQTFTVYQGRLADGQAVICKTVSGRRWIPDAIARLENEYTISRGLTHPGQIVAPALIRTDQGLMLVSDDPGDRSLDSIATPPLPPETVVRLIRKNPEDRFQTAADFINAVERPDDGVAPVPSTLRIPDRLYGCKAMIERLNALMAGQAEGKRGGSLLRIAGQSGIGKSALVERLAATFGGHFIQGKFDQTERTRPYAPFVQAFKALLRSLLAGTTEQVDAWHTYLLDALSPNARVLLDILSGYEILIGPQPPVAKLGLNEAQVRMSLVCRRFVGALAREDSPLVIFIDDLQWSDSASRSLIELLWIDPEIRHLTILTAYPDNEIGPGHPVAGLFATLEEKRGLPPVIEAGPLGQAAVSEPLADALGHPTAEVEDQAARAVAKTGGNLFFVRQFLRALQRKQLLVYDVATGRWHWDLAAVDLEQITDNVADLVIERILALPAATREMVQIAACRGNLFETEITDHLIAGQRRLDPDGRLRLRRVLAKLVSAELPRAGRTTRDPAELPPMQDPRKLAAMQIMALLAPPACFSAPDLLPLIALRMVQMSVGYGNAPGSAYAYVLDGLVHCAVLADPVRGLAYGDPARQVAVDLDARDLEGRILMVYAGFIQRWSAPLVETLPIFHHGYHHYGHASYAFMGGLHLAKVSDYLESHQAAEGDARHEKTRRIMRMAGFGIARMRGLEDAIHVAGGERESEDESFAVWTEQRDATSLADLHKYRMLDALMRGDSREVLARARGTEANLNGIVSMAYEPFYQFYEALALIELGATDGAAVSVIRRARARRLTRRLERWARHAPDSFAHRALLLRAELVAVAGWSSRAIGLFDASVAAARRAGALHDVGLFLERAARFYLKRGAHTAAAGYFSEAVDAFEVWGASAWSHVLAESDGDLVQPRTIRVADATETGSSSSSHGQIVDSAALIRAAAARARKVSLKDVVTEVMRAMVINAGATRGVLLLDVENRLPVAAETLGAQAAVSIENARLYDSLGGSLERRTELTVTHARFVPHQFLETLGRPPIGDIKLGDHVLTTASILFSDIRGFTSLVEGMAPVDAIHFINTYLSRMEPAVLAEGGFIDNSVGDAIMAVFDRGADASVRAGIAMPLSLGDWARTRERQGQSPIRIGVGTATGEMIFGTIGAANRLKCGVVGDTVNLAARIEGLTKHYRLGLLIGRKTYPSLDDPERYLIREIDLVTVAGREAPVRFYEVFDADREPLREQKRRTRDTFSDGLRLYPAGDEDNATGTFGLCRDLAPDDPLPMLLTERCGRFRDHSAAPAWDGIERIGLK